RSRPSCSTYAVPIACSASSPRLPSAARWNSSSGGGRRPRSRRRGSPARRTRRARRRGSPRAAPPSSSAPPRPWGGSVITHNLAKSLCDPVELALPERRVERQRERVLERVLGAREDALPAVRPQPMERVGADLSLDPLGTERGQHPVPALDLDHVRLPTVHVAVV